MCIKLGIGELGTTYLGTLGKDVVLSVPNLIVSCIGFMYITKGIM